MLRRGDLSDHLQEWEGFPAQAPHELGWKLCVKVLDLQPPTARACRVVSTLDAPRAGWACRPVQKSPMQLIDDDCSRLFSLRKVKEQSGANHFEAWVSLRFNAKHTLLRESCAANIPNGCLLPLDRPSNQQKIIPRNDTCYSPHSVQ